MILPAEYQAPCVTFSDYLDTCGRTLWSAPRRLTTLLMFLQEHIVIMRTGIRLCHDDMFLQEHIVIMLADV